MVLINGNAEKGGAIYTTESLTLNNATFIDNYASKSGGAVALYDDVTLDCNNSKFIDNYADEGGSSIVVAKGKLNLYNTYITSKVYAKAGQIMGSIGARFYLENITFANTTATYSPAIYVVGSKIRIIDSKFINLKANLTAGAMSLREGGELYIKNCEFINTTSSRNAGAVYVDITGYAPGNVGNVTIIDSKFKDASSEFAGAYVQLGGQFWLNNTEFINSHAIYNGGAIYLSFTETEINNCTFESNGVEVIEGYPTYGGAIFSDMSTLNITDSKFFNNVASAGNAICAYDSSYNIRNSLFENNSNPIYTFFDKVGVLDNNVYINDDNISTNNTFYATIMVGEGMPLTLINNTIDVDTLPARFDLRDWGWVSSVKNQGWMGACWTFGMSGSLESVLLKAIGIPFNVSMNNMKTVMKYSPYGAMEVFEGGANLASVGYLLSWLGAIPYDADTYDELGKITKPIATDQNIHVQDVTFIPNNEIPNGTQMKLAILKYGSLDVSFFGQETFDAESPYYNPETYAHYVNVPEGANHEVSIIGWDDNFPKEKFLITPPGDGAWIVKNSYGTGWGDNGFFYVSYYDQSLLAYTPGKVTDYAAVAIIENTEPYNKNYQYDITWLSNFEPSKGNISYMNVFEALDDDLIAAVGTYFNQSGTNYAVEIYVNDELKLTQEGVSPYVGYHTIKLDSYIPIKKGDVFKAVMTSNWVPYLLLEDTRVHYTQNISFVSFDGQPWQDAYDLGYIACLKVYTVDEDSRLNTSIMANESMTVVVSELKDGQKFNMTLVSDGEALANKTMSITFNGATDEYVTDENGMIFYEIPQVSAGNYTIDMEFAGDAIYNPANASAIVNVVKAESKIYLRNALYFVTQTKMVKVTLWDGNNNAVAGKTVHITIDNSTWSGVTDENGTASIRVGVGYGNHNATVSFDGDDEYAASNRTGVVRVIKETPSIMLRGADSTFNVKDTSKTVKIYLWDRESKPLPAGSKVAIKVNGQTYIGYTDSEGIAKINIDINSAGTYEAELKYAGNSAYNAVSKKTKIYIRD